MSTTPWAMIEAEVYDRLNNLASTSIAMADTAYRTIPKLAIFPIIELMGVSFFTSLEK